MGRIFLLMNVAASIAIVGVPAIVLRPAPALNGLQVITPAAAPTVGFRTSDSFGHIMERRKEKAPHEAEPFEWITKLAFVTGPGNS